MEDLGLSYAVAMHGVQSAIKFIYEQEGIDTGGVIGNRLKHHRVGIDGSKLDMLGLVELLISKGIFTKEEYVEHMRLAANTELAMHEAEIAQKYPGMKMSFR